MSNDWAVSQVMEVAEENRNKLHVNNGQVMDLRIRLEVDPKRVETWELMALESGKITDWCLIFARYAATDRGLVSPDLPNTPIDELTADEKKQIMDSRAYKAMKRFTIDQLKKAVAAFQEQLAAGF